MFTANNKTYTFSRHARHRVSNRECTVDDVIAGLESPKSRRLQECRNVKGRKHWHIIGSNNLVIITNEHDNLIVTVYWYTREFYQARNKNKRNKNKRSLKKEHGQRYDKLSRKRRRRKKMQEGY
jgi:hypothetical protein